MITKVRTEHGRPRPVLPTRGEGARATCARLLLLCVALVAASPSSLSAAEVAATEQKEEAKPKIILRAELETKLAEFLKKAAEAKRKLFTERMKKEIEKAGKVAGLGADGLKALEAPAEQAIEASLAAWKDKSEEGWRKWVRDSANDSEEVLDQVFSQSENSDSMDWFGGYTQPLQQAKWEDGLRRVLAPQQFAAWDKARAERDAAVKKEIADLLKATVERTRQQQVNVLQTKGTAIKNTLALSKERAKELDTLASTVADTAAAGWRKRGEQALLAMEDEQRRLVVKGRGFYLAVEEKEAEALQTAWKDGVAKFLSTDEGARLRATQEEFKTRRIAAMGQVLVTQLDEQVGFTASQRERLQPIAARLAATDPALFPDLNQESYYRLNIQSLLATGSKASAGEMKAILDETQWKRWQDACTGKTIRSPRGFVAIRPAVRTASVKPPARPGDPEDLENAIPDYLHEKATAERKRLLALHLLKAEDAARVAGLAPEATRRLETAARGVTEEALAAWRTTTDQSIRSQLRDATPENIKQRLAGMENYSYSRSFGGTPETHAIWETTVKAEMNEAQRAAWQKELDARIVARDKAIAATVMTEFDRRNPLSPEQWRILEPIIAGTVKDYAPDIGRMFSYSYANAWYLQSYSMFIPFAAVPEKDLKQILGKEGWERWTGSQEFANTSNYWDNVQQYHTQRLKEKKK